MKAGDIVVRHGDQDRVRYRVVELYEGCDELVIELKRPGESGRDCHDYLSQDLELMPS